jgi:hypothetical protein
VFLARSTLISDSIEGPARQLSRLSRPRRIAPMPITRRRLRLGPGAEFERPLFANVSSLLKSCIPWSAHRVSSRPDLGGRYRAAARLNQICCHFPVALDRAEMIGQRSAMRWRERSASHPSAPPPIPAETPGVDADADRIATFPLGMGSQFSESDSG